MAIALRIVPAVRGPAWKASILASASTKIKWRKEPMCGLGPRYTTGATTAASSGTARFGHHTDPSVPPTAIRAAPFAFDFHAEPPSAADGTGGATQTATIPWRSIVPGSRGTGSGSTRVCCHPDIGE